MNNAKTLKNSIAKLVLSSMDYLFLYGEQNGQHYQEKNSKAKKIPQLSPMFQVSLNHHYFKDLCLLPYFFIDFFRMTSKLDL